MGGVIWACYTGLYFRLYYTVLVMSVTYARLFDWVDDARASSPLFKESGPAEKLRALDTRASSAKLVLRDMCGRAAGSRSRSIRSLRVVCCTPLVRPLVRKLLTVHRRAGSVRPWASRRCTQGKRDQVTRAPARVRMVNVNCNSAFDVLVHVRLVRCHAMRSHARSY